MSRPLMLVLAALLAGPALAAHPPKAPAKDPLVCTQETATGSHLKKRVCMTQSERKARQLADQQRARDLQKREFKTNVEN